jgi:hypothetical protein
MKTSKLFLMGTLVLMLFMIEPVKAFTPTFTGDAEVDFPDVPGVLIIDDPGNPGGVPGEIPVVYPVSFNDANVYTSGWDMKDLRLAYDEGTDTMYVAVNSFGIVGDVDGNGDPATLRYGVSSPFTENADLCGGESVAVYFDLNMDPNNPGTFNNATDFDFIVGVSGATCIGGFTAAQWYLPAGFNPPSNFGTELDGTTPGTYNHIGPTPTNPSAAWPDFELTIPNFSKIPISLGIPDPFLTVFRVGAYMGSPTDGAIGEDYIHYEQNPRTMATIEFIDNGNGTVDLTVKEKNNTAYALRGQQEGPNGSTIDMAVPFHDVVVDITKSEDGGLPTSLVSLGYPTRPPNDGDDPILEILDDVAGSAPGEEWLWDSRTSDLNDVPVAGYPIETTFIATATGRDPLGLPHTFLGDPNEQDAVDVNQPPPTPEIDVTKTVDCNETIAGYPVYYTICIKNIGVVPVIPTSVFDDKLGDLTADFVAACPLLQPPPTDPCECCLTFGPYYEDPNIDPDPNTNTVYFDANDIFGTAAPTVDANATVDLIHPDFTVEKICLTDPVEDANACFRIIITNIGDVDLSIITNEPSLLGPLPLPVGGPPIDVNICVSVPIDVTEVCNEIIVEATIDEPNYICIDGEPLPPKDANDCCPVQPPGGDEGCTPGFWKNNADKHDASAWCILFDPNMHISDVFDLNEPLVIFTGGNPKKLSSYITNPTLLQALDANGGGVNAMIRHGIAAMLNACSDCVNYPNNNPFEIIMMIEDALNGEQGALTVDELHSLFAGWNESGCPIDQHGRCSHPLLDFMD